MTNQEMPIDQTPQESERPSNDCFERTIFQENISERRTVPSTSNGAEIELPDYDVLFERIRRVSPLARSVLDGHKSDRSKEVGLDMVDDDWPQDFQWTLVKETDKEESANRIEKIDNFQNSGIPIFRFRVKSLHGDVDGHKFADLMTTYKRRVLWDPNIDVIEELYPVSNLDLVNETLEASGGKFGVCTRFSIGYCRGKALLAVSPREQLLLCSIHDFGDGNAIIWSLEMEDWHDHLLPAGHRQVRAKTHLFVTTIVQTGPSKYDIEYVLHVEAGGMLPTWITTPVTIDTVEKMFRYARTCFDTDEVTNAEEVTESD